MTDFPFDVSPYLSRDESQHYERKSLFEGEPGSKHSRQAKAVRDQVARCVAGFANAEGGVMVLGGNKNNGIPNKDKAEFNSKRDAELEIFNLPLILQEKIRSLGKRPKQEKLLPVIHEVCNQGRWVTLAELAKFFGYKNKSNLAKHTNKLVQEKQIVQRFPEKPSDPRQAYKALSPFYNSEQTEISQQVLTSQPQAEN